MSESRQPFGRLPIDPELRKLVAACCSGTAAPDQRRRLDELIETQQGAAEFYVAHALLFARLHDPDLYFERKAINEYSWQKASKKTKSRTQASLLSLLPSVSRRAASLLFVSVALLSVLIVLSIAVRAAAHPAARLSRSSDVKWTADARCWSVGDVLHEGDAVRLNDGRVEIVFDSGAAMTVVGPADLEVHSAHRVTLRSGTATTRVDNVDSGEFRVLTPAADVLDLGTEFGVRVGPGGEETDVVVFDGAVDLTPLTNNVAGRSASRRLSVGEAVRVNRSGGWERVVSVESDAFPFGDDMFDIKRTRPPAIVGVSDDRRSPESPKFYRICHEGLDEDVRAFVDRVHEWNGVTEDGIPAFLRGADYIATFNDDKDDSPWITVELSRPAVVYVFYDDRMAVPDWLSESFEDTGLKIGLDEGPSANETFELGVGPGVSIDQVHTIWRRRVQQGGSVTLGPAGEKMEGRTMYGIATQPL